MMSPAAAFSAAGATALICWLVLAVSLFAPPVRRWAWPATGLAVPAAIAVAYILLIRQGFAEAHGGGFNTIAEVRALFASDAALAAGWLHYLAFDLFVGTWIAREGTARRMHPLLLLPCLALTFMLGPAGLLLFLLARLATGRRAR